MQKLLNKVNQLAAQIPNASIVNNAVSEASIGWHIEHSCLVIIKIAETIQQSDAKNYHTQFNLRKYIVLLTGKFPRGRAKAPASVLPVNNSNLSELGQCIEHAKAAIQTLKSTEKNKFFKHPIFGNLNVPKTIQFLAIHTQHHLRIIEDILK